MKAPVDMLGREIKVGDTIAYALTAGRSANLAIYTVLELVPGEGYGYYTKDDGTKTYGHHKFLKLRVQKSRQSYGGEQSKPSVLGMADARALVINETAESWQ
jgi:hypothetical protein